MKAARLLTAISINSSLASFVAQAICGVIRQFFALKRGLYFAGGSIESTSIAAQAIIPLFRTSARSDSTTTGPLEVFNRNADFFILFKLLALMSPFVSGSNGQCILTISACARTSYSSAHLKFFLSD